MTEAYRHILFAVDFTEDAARVGARAVDLAERYGARLSLLHVVEYLPLDLGDGVMPVEPLGVDEDLLKQARERLAELGEQLGRTDAELFVEVGATKEGVARVAAAEGVDLVVVGSHHRHGLALLLGSTAKAVLGAAPCDVLAVRIAEV